MTRKELITSDEYIKAISECIIRSGRSVKQMRKEMNEKLFALRDELIEIGNKKESGYRTEGSGNGWIKIISPGVSGVIDGHTYKDTDTGA